MRRFAFHAIRRPERRHGLVPQHLVDRDRFPTSLTDIKGQTTRFGKTTNRKCSSNTMQISNLKLKKIYEKREIKTNQDKSRLIKINREILRFYDVQATEFKNNQEISYDGWMLHFPRKHIVLYS